MGERKKESGCSGTWMVVEMHLSRDQLAIAPMT